MVCVIIKKVFLVCILFIVPVASAMLHLPAQEVLENALKVNGFEHFTQHSQLCANLANQKMTTEDFAAQVKAALDVYCEQSSIVADFEKQNIFGVLANLAEGGDGSIPNLSSYHGKSKKNCVIS